jgi:hypothetical protein
VREERQRVAPDARVRAALEVRDELGRLHGQQLPRESAKTLAAIARIAATNQSPSRCDRRGIAWALHVSQWRLKARPGGNVFPAG